MIFRIENLPVCISLSVPTPKYIQISLMIELLKELSEVQTAL